VRRNLCAAGQSDQLCLFLAIELTPVFAVWGFASYRAFQDALEEAPPDPGYASCGELKGTGNALVRPCVAFRPFASLEQNASTALLACGAFASANPFEKTTPLLDRKFNTVLFSAMRLRWCFAKSNANTGNI
jgi:hypothetical protein